jgi:molecular chaperone DnaK
MVKDAEEHADEDKKRKEDVEVKNKGDSLVFQAEKALKDHKDKIPEKLTKEIQGKIDTLKKALESNDISSIKAATTDLETYIQKIGEEIQKQGAAQQQAGPGAGPMGSEAPRREEKKEEEIEEAEVEILDEEK